MLAPSGPSPGVSIRISTVGAVVSGPPTPEQAAVDYLAGMTDHYAIRLAERQKPGIRRGLFAGVSLG